LTAPLAFDGESVQIRLTYPKDDILADMVAPLGGRSAAPS